MTYLSPGGAAEASAESLSPQSGAVNIKAASRPTAHAVGYDLAPLPGLVGHMSRLSRAGDSKRGPEYMT
ncbi:hypothetical protein SBA2_450085 [Acidobacteriia bacterium SbA2]|nr:hypothetical protein SBA2_450085 [Acidobacteriia bacterium SbA2]